MNLSFLASEPAVVWAGAVDAIVSALIVFAPRFGVQLSQPEQAALLAVVNVIVAIIIRQQVTPNSSLPQTPK